jgi:hypothetical protein
MEKPKDRNKHKPPMKSFEEAMPRCNRYTEGRTVTAAPVLCNMDLATIWRVKAPNLPKYAIAKTSGTKIWVLFKDGDPKPSNCSDASESTTCKRRQ